MRHLGARGGGADMVRKFADLVGARDEADLFRRVVAQWREPERLLIEQPENPGDLFDRPGNWPEGRGLAERMLYWDQRTFLCDSVLTKVDRASMAHGLEVRTPLLDHRVVEYVWSLGPGRRLPAGGRPKELLLRVAERFFEPGFFDRPKQGFSMPVGQWMRGELRPWMEELIRPERLRNEGFFNPDYVASIWREHLEGRVNWHYPLWNIAVFQSWLSQVR